MPVTTLKIDRSFIADLPGDRGAAVLVATIIQLAQSLGLQPLAEGIETEEQRRFLIEHGCPLGQGSCSAGRSRPARSKRSTTAAAKRHKARGYPSGHADHHHGTCD